MNFAFKGGITTYVLIMFGMGLMLYMFGFHSTMQTYLGSSDITGTGNVNGTSITDPNMQTTENNPLFMIVKGIADLTTNNPLLIGGTLATLIIGGIIARIAGINLNVIYGYLVPIFILGVFLNIFVFPVDSLNNALANMVIPPGLPISWVLIGFFNLFFILAVLDWVRGGTT